MYVFIITARRIVNRNTRLLRNFPDVSQIKPVLSSTKPRRSVSFSKKRISLITTSSLPISSTFFSTCAIHLGTDWNFRDISFFFTANDAEGLLFFISFNTLGKVADISVSLMYNFALFKRFKWIFIL